MQENNDETVLLKRTTDGFSFTASSPMKAREMYLPEPIDTTRAVVVVSFVTDGELRVVFNSEPTLSRNTRKPVLCFVVGQDENSRTVVREGNPGVVLAETKEKQALLLTQKGTDTTFWFSFDASIRVAAFGLGNQPRSDSTLLVVPDWHGCFDKPNCQLFIGLANWERPVQLNLFNYQTSGLRLNHFPDKFNDDKTVKSFPGVTCICRVNETSHGTSIAKALIRAQEMLKETGPTVGGCFSYLPPDSFHMTIADLVTPRNTLTVSPHINGDNGQVGEELRQRSKEVIAMAASNVFYMKMEGVLLHNNFSVRLRPYEEKTAQAIAAWRDLLYKHVRIPYSKDYKFHITLAYRILPINESNARAVLAATEEKIYNMLVESEHFSLLPVSTPELCTFADMSNFHKI